MGEISDLWKEAVRRKMKLSPWKERTVLIDKKDFYRSEGGF